MAINNQVNSQSKGVSLFGIVVPFPQNTWDIFFFWVFLSFFFFFFFGLFRATPAAYGGSQTRG